MQTKLGRDESIPFRSPKIIPILIGSFLFLFVAGVVLMTFLEKTDREPNPSSFSYCALGHHALVQILDACNFTVIRGRHYFYKHIQEKMVLFLQPSRRLWADYTHEPISTSLQKIVTNDNIVLLTWPKWRILHPSAQNSQWVGDWIFLSADDLSGFSSEMGQDVQVKRIFANKSTLKTAWNKTYAIQCDSLQYFAYHQGKVLVSTQDQKPIVVEISNSNLNKGRLILVADPEIFTNMGVGKEENGMLALDMLQDLQPNKDVIVDEIAHGLGRPPSVLRALLTHPGIYITLQILLIGLFLAWLVGVRFRPPLAEPKRSRSLEEQIKAFAHITCAGNQHEYFLGKYLKSVIQELAERFPMIVPMPMSQKIEYLDQLGKAFGNPYSILSLYQKSLRVHHPRNISFIAKGIHQWKERMISLKK